MESELGWCAIRLVFTKCILDFDPFLMVLRHRSLIMYGYILPPLYACLHYLSIILGFYFNLMYKFITYFSCMCTI